jgi:hypothetical protein
MMSRGQARRHNLNHEALRSMIAILRVLRRLESQQHAHAVRRTASSWGETNASEAPQERRELNWAVSIGLLGDGSWRLSS